MAKNKLPAADVTEDPHYHDTSGRCCGSIATSSGAWRFPCVRFAIGSGSTMARRLKIFWNPSIWPVRDLSGTELEHQAKCIEQSHKMLCLVDSAVDLMRAKHKNGEEFYWLLYYAYLSPQELQNVEEIIDQLRPHIRDISTRTYYRKRKEAVEVLSSVLWGIHRAG